MLIKVIKYEEAKNSKGVWEFLGGEQVVRG